MWQLAKILKPKRGVFDEYAGLEVWVLAEPPHGGLLDRRYYDVAEEWGRVYSTNIRDPNGQLYTVPVEAVELLPTFEKRVRILSHEEHERRCYQWRDEHQATQ